MRPLRICVDCGSRHRLAGYRCRPCELTHQRARNAARGQYQGAWKATSRRARRAQPWCSVCGTPFDLTTDHERAQVECRSCNSAHRRNPA